MKKLPRHLLTIALLVSTHLGCSPVLASRPAWGNSISYYTAEGGVVIKGSVFAKHAICVMPPAQAVRQRTGEGSGNVSVKGGKQVDVTANVSASTEHETAKLFEQTSATIFMQQGLYRICEMAANGAFGAFKKDATENSAASQAYQAAVEEVMRQTFELILVEAEIARAKRMEDAKELYKAMTPQDKEQAMSLIQSFTESDSRIDKILAEIAGGTDKEKVSSFLNDPEPAVRRAANRRLWRLEELEKPDSPEQPEAPQPGTSKPTPTAPPR